MAGVTRLRAGTMLSRAAVGVAAAIGAVAVSPSAGAAETKGYVVSYFYDASYNGGDEDCPKGTNLSAIDFYRRDLAHAGYSHDEIEKALKDFPGEGGLKQPWVPMVITRGNKKDNVYIHPETMPDMGLKTVEGRYAYGFNLDGKGAASPNAFEDPETHEKGVNNQMYRAMGCIRSYRGLPPPGRPSLPENLWDVLRDVDPAWVITITSEDSLSKDGPVTVTFDRAVERITRDASGAAAQADMTFHRDPDPRSHNVLKGQMKDGVVTIEPADFRMILDPYEITEVNMTNTHMRIKTNPDGSIRVVLGGYQPWRTLYHGLTDQGYIKEYAASIDLPALYWAFKRMADADPDPQTGENRRISSTYMIEAVPAFVLPPKETKPMQAASAAPTH